MEFYTGPDKKCTLLYTDTDSLMIEVQTPDWHADMLANLELFDTSNFSPDHPSYSLSNA